MHNFKTMNKQIYTLLSFTWGLPLSLIGSLVALVLLTLGYKPIPHGYGYCFKIGESWGGLNLGYFSFICKDAPERTPKHEFGHGLQNCYYGIFTPFIVTIPSAIRYWYYMLKYAQGTPVTTPYDAIWFESQATEWGYKEIEKISKL